MPEKRGAASRMDAHHHSSDTYDANGVIQCRPRASSGVSLRPQLLTSRIRSRSLLKAAAAAASDGTASSNTASTTDENASSRMADCPPPIDAAASPSPKFGATLLPRLAAVFAGSGSGGDNNSNSNSYTSKSDNSSNRQYTSYSQASQLPAFPSHPISPDRASLLSDSASSLLTFNGDADSTTTPSSSTMPSTPSSSMNGIVDNPFMGTTSTVKGKSSSNSNGSPIASLPFLPRRRTLSNLFSQFTGGSSKDKELNNNSNSKKETNKESSSPPLAGAHPSGTSASKMMHVPTQGWSTSAALPTPPPSASASTSYSNPFASAFSSHYHASPSHSGSVSGSQAVVRPGSPRLKKKDSYLALNIPPTPGASTPSLAYTENGNRPLRGEDEDYMLPSPIIEADEQEHPTHVEHRHKYSHHPASSSDSYNNSNLNSIAAQPISSTSSFLSSLTSTAPTLSTHRASHQTLSTLLPPILFLCISFVISLTIMFYMVSTIPLQIPHNISEIKMQTVALRDYSRKGLSEGLHVSAVLSALFVFKQAFSVPGSILVNILFGSLYGTVSALFPQRSGTSAY